MLNDADTVTVSNNLLSKFMEWIGHFGEIQNMKGFWK